MVPVNHDSEEFPVTSHFLSTGIRSDEQTNFWKSENVEARKVLRKAAEENNYGDEITPGKEDGERVYLKFNVFRDSG